jgi:hypothetical protein
MISNPGGEGRVRGCSRQYKYAALNNNQLKAIWSEIQARLVAFKTREERDCATSGDMSDCAFFPEWTSTGFSVDCLQPIQ